jgi:hypothetical protein
MIQAPPERPDLGVDFLSWLNTELRRHIEGGPKESDDVEDEKTVASGGGIVNRLKAYLTRA